MLQLFIITVSVFLVFSFLHYAAKKKKPYKRALLSMLTGVLTLFAANLFSGMTGVYLPVTKLSLFVSLAGGVPGVSLLVLLTVL